MCSPRKAGYYEGIVGSIFPGGIKCSTRLHYWSPPPLLLPLILWRIWAQKIHSISQDVSISSWTFNHCYWVSVGCLIETGGRGRSRMCSISLWHEEGSSHCPPRGLQERWSSSPDLFEGHFGWFPFFPTVLNPKTIGRSVLIIRAAPEF